MIDTNKVETFTIWVCHKEPFEKLFIKNKVTTSYKMVEAACILVNKPLEKTNYCLAYEPASNN